MQIGKTIVDWYQKHGRRLSWRDSKDPYQIWIAEIIFQQTRIAQGESYLFRFLNRFPNVETLARADPDEVLKAWEGLGYYSRARNLHHAAQHILFELNGIFPTDYTEWIKLKGIGPYTARAIGSFAYDNPVGVLDGNVMRVMSRVLNDSSPINQPKTRKHFQALIDEWASSTQSRPFNFGMMDIGSTICTPTKPACLICPLVEICEARKAGTTDRLPFKEKKLKRTTRYLNFYLLTNEAGQLAIRQRPPKGIWGGLWEIPNEETEHRAWKNRNCPYGGSYFSQLKHVLTHMDMMIHVYQLVASEPLPWQGLTFISRDKIPIFAFSKAVLKIFERLDN